MALIRSLFSGVSGLKNHQTMMDVIGNNIANVDTVGYKGSRVTFSDTFNQFYRSGMNPTDTQGGVNTFQIGLGSKVSSIDRNWTQGPTESTSSTTDLALQGPGLFVLKSNGQTFYSRAGAFEFDSEGNLVNTSNGAIVQGKVANGLGELPAGNAVGDIKVDNNMTLPAIATTEISWGGNLQSSASVTRSENIVVTGNVNSGGTFPFVRNSQIYDESGAEYTYQATYTQNAVGSYNVAWTLLDSTGANVGAGGPINVTFDGAGNQTAPAAPVNITGPNGIDFNIDFTGLTESTNANTVSAVVDEGREPTIVDGAVTIFDSLGVSHTMSIRFTKLSDLNWTWTASVPPESGVLANNTGTITFNSNGTINSMNPAIPQVTFTPVGGAEVQTIDLEFGSGQSGVTQTSLNSSISALSQNGTASATLSNITIDQYGMVIGVFSNGYTRELAQIMVATFTNRDGLISVGDNMFQISANTGLAVIGELGEDTGTTVQSNALESSNVDLSEEFTRMIIAQRGFEANSKIITTSDSMLQVITNLIR
jgi:flagellar hook protein FlgE